MLNLLLSMSNLMNRLLDSESDSLQDIYDVTRENDGKIESIADFAVTLEFLLRKILGPILIVIGAIGVIYAIYLGVMYAKAEDASKRKEIQGRLIGAIIGAVIIIVAATICLAIDWKDVYFSFQGQHTFADSNGDRYCDYCGHQAGQTKFHG